MIASYESILSDMSYEDLKIALQETVRIGEFWPTPGYIRRKLDDFKSMKGRSQNHKVWKPPEDWENGIDDSTKEQRIAEVKELRDRIGKVSSQRSM